MGLKRIAILTAGGDTPALNATIHGAVVRANQERIEVFGIVEGFSGLLNERAPHVRLNPLFQTIPELDPCAGGTLLGASRTYVDPTDTNNIEQVVSRLRKLRIEGLICIGGDGTINGMQPLSEKVLTVLAPKTIDNDLGLNYLDEPNEWVREPGPKPGKHTFRRLPGRDEIELDDIVNYATPGYATAVYVAASGVQRIRTTAESHRRIAIIEVMGRDSGYIALGSAFGQPDLVLIPEAPVQFDRFVQRVHDLYELQKHVVIVCGEGVTDEQGHQLGAVYSSVDPAGNTIFSGAAEELKRRLEKALGEKYFSEKRPYEAPNSAIFTRKIGHTQRGGRPIAFDRFCAAQLGGKAVDLLVNGFNNSIATLQWTRERGFYFDCIMANKLRDQWGMIHSRQVHKSFYDGHRFQLSKLGTQYLTPIFEKAIGVDDLEEVRQKLFSTSNLTNRYQSVIIDIQKRIEYLPNSST